MEAARNPFTGHRYASLGHGCHIPSSSLTNIRNTFDRVPVEGQPHSFIPRNPPPQALSFESVNGFHPAVSRVPFFQTPQILADFSPTDLASLALVDRDCRQLARSYQFTSIFLNYSDPSWALLSKLMDEASDSLSAAPGEILAGMLGPCIRNITVAARDPPGTRGAKKRNQIQRHQSFMRKLQIVLQVAVPNLETLSWRDKVPMTLRILDAIGNSPITRLELHSVDIDEGLETLFRKESTRWRLRSLYLRLSCSTPETTIVNFSHNILRLAAPTLEELVFDGSREGPLSSSCDHHMAKHSFGAEPLYFPRLQKLLLLSVAMADESILQAFFPQEQELMLSLLSLESTDARVAPYLARRGHISSLKKLHWPGFSSFQEAGHCLSFISANPQLQSFVAHRPEKLLDDCLVPLFSSEFRCLTTLALVWGTKEIGQDSLRLIGGMHTLRRLWLCAAPQSSWDNQRVASWQVDHEMMIVELAPLKQLQWLALTRDRYDTPVERTHIGSPWEVKHRDKVVGHALSYAVVFPELEWVHFGETPIYVERNPKSEYYRYGPKNSTYIRPGGWIVVAPLTAGRKDHQRLLLEMWGVDLCHPAHYV